MLYRPNFCCHCGEKIARSRWTLLTSRRFCDFCEVEQKQYDLLPRATVVVAVLIGAAGLTAYVSGGGQAPNKMRASGVSAPKAAPSPAQLTRESSSSSSVENRGLTPIPPSGTVSGQPPKQPPSSTEPVFFCGAVTRKGTACTRRVKTRTRCWQHAGKPDAPDNRAH